MKKIILERFYTLLNSNLGDIKELTKEQKQLPSYITQRPQGDYLGRGGEFERQNRPSIDFNTQFKIALPKLEKKYTCLPTVSTNLMGGKTSQKVDPEMRISLLRVFYFISKNSGKIKSAFKCDDNTLLYLFKLAIAAMDQQTGIGTQYQDNESLGRAITKADSIVSDILSTLTFSDTTVSPVMSVAKSVKGKEASVGPYQMHPSNFEKSEKTLKITKTKKSDTTKLFKDIIVSTLSVMEYFLNNYKKIKQKNGFSGPSVDENGKKIPGSSGDYNWDIAIASYAFDFENRLSKKYCKTSDPNYPGYCDSPNGVYQPGWDSIVIKHKRGGVPWPEGSFVKGEFKQIDKFELKKPIQVINNYLPLLFIGSDTTRSYVKWYTDYVNNKLSCFNTLYKD